MRQEHTEQASTPMLAAWILLGTIGTTWSAMLTGVLLASSSAAAGALIAALSLPWLAAFWALASGPATAWLRQRQLRPARLAGTGRAAARPFRMLATGGAFRIW
jgi:hypothetical protein